MAEQATIKYLLDLFIEIGNTSRDPRASDDDIAKLEPLTNNLNYFSAFLKYASSKKVNDERAPEFARQVREALSEAEFEVETFVSQSLSAKSKNWFSKLHKDKDPFKLDGIAQKVHKVRDEVEKVFGEKLEIVEDGSEKIEVPSMSIRKKHVVGLEESAKAIIGRLKEQTEQLDIISIVGEPGIGKSTLARKVFDDPSIQDEFPMRLWVSVSKYTLKTVFLSTLTGFNVNMKDMHRYREYDLATLIKRHIDGKKFLIIFDDVRTPEDWNNLTYSLPASSNLGKVLITSRLEEVALKANPNKPPHKLDFLDSKESIQLLQYEVEPTWETEFETHGKTIVDKCKGFPPAIAVIGGIIRGELSAIVDRAEKVDAWAKFSERVHHLLADDEGLMEKVISLSYESLPSHLKACFLYFGMFPESVEIPIRKLYQMWTAEGFIQQRTDSIDPDEIAESYLRELINRNLVGVGKTSLDGRLKTCTVHVSVQDFCKKQGGAEKENFLHEVIIPEDLLPKPTDDIYRIQKPVIDMENSYRRLCIHTHIPVFAAAKPMGRQVRTVVCTSMGDVYLPLEHIATISGGFKLIRVFDVKPIRFPKLPATLFDLLHLRFVHLNYDISSIPPAITRMWNIQTLIVEATVKTLEIRADIWKMRYLTHLKTNKNASLPAPNEETALAESKLETLSIIPPESCTEKVVDKLRNLKRVIVRGKLAKLLTGNVAEGEGSFDNIAKLIKLEKLKLLNELPNENRLNDRLPNLPPSNMFPPNLRILTLSDTLIDWSHMKVIASLYNLEVLKLKKDAFTGETWETEGGGFVRLSFLFIGNLDLVNWKTSAAHFPALVGLKLLKCEKLLEVPVEFAKIPSFKELALNSCESAVDSAKEIKKQKTEADKAVEFKLTIVSS